MRSLGLLARMAATFALSGLLAGMWPAVATAAPAWLDRVNMMRAYGGLPAVSDEAAWSAGCWKHSRYMAENNWIGHTEDPANPWYSAEGAAAAGVSNAYLGIGGNDAIDGWMRTPFHGVGIIDTRLSRVGFGTYTTTAGRSAATLDVLRGLGSVAPGTTFPVTWPSNGGALPFLSFPGHEYPDPLAGLGWTAPSGAPTFIIFGGGSYTPNVSASSLTGDGVPVEHTAFSETTFMSPDAAQQSLGRAVLGMRDAVVILPRQPLVYGKTYVASVTESGRTYTWSFTAGDIDPPYTYVSGTVSRSGGSATANLVARDNASGIAATYYSVDGAAFVAGTSVTVNGIGSHTLTFYSVDNAGNVESARSQTVDVLAATAPVTPALPGHTLYTPVTPSTVYYGRGFTLSSFLKPRHKAGLYSLKYEGYRYERQSNGTYKWVRRATWYGKNYNYSTYTKSIKYGTVIKLRGKWKVRAVHTHTGYLPKFSAWRYFTVR